MTFIHYHECLPNYTKIMVIYYHSKKLYFQHFDFFVFFKKSLHHAIFFRIFFIKNMVLLLSCNFQTVRFYGIVFESPSSRPTLSVFFTFQCDALSIALIYHMVFKSLQKKVVYHYILLPYITIKKMKLNKKR